MSRKETRSNVREWDDYYARPRWQSAQSMGLLGTYRAAATFLDAPGAVIQDWGGGTGYAARYFSQAASYQVIDGSFNTPASEHHGLIVADLATFASPPADGILLRHVLTHCHHGTWRAVLANLVRSTRARAVVILAHPYAEQHQVVLHSNRKSSYDEQQFTRDEIWDVIYEAERGMTEAPGRLAVSERAYRHEQMIYLARGEENIRALPAPSWLIPRNGAWTAAAEIQAEEKEGGSSSHAG